MSNHRRIKKVRKRLFDENPYCPQCGVLMILPDEVPDHSKGKKKKFPDNMCTYEHHFSRLNSKRGTKSFVNGILCLKCNSDNCEKDMTDIGKEGLRQRSQFGKKRNRNQLSNL